MWQRRHAQHPPGTGPLLLFYIALTLAPSPCAEPSDRPPDPLKGVDFLELSGCALQPTLIRHNSNLGRQAKPSQQLLLELEYLQRAPGCITRLRRSQKQALAARLHQAWQLKRAQLPRRIFDATLGSEEYRAFWRVTPHPGHYPRSSDAVAASALVEVNRLVRRWLDGDYRAHNRAFELLLGEVAGGAGGVTLQALSRLDGDPLPGTQDERRYHALLLPIEALEEQLTATLPRPYRSWMKHRNQRLANFIRR